MADQKEEQQRLKDVDGGWAWVVLFASFMNLLIASGIGFVSGIFQKLFLEEFGESVAFTAWVTALFSALMQLAGPLSGLLTSVTNCRVTAMAGGAMLAGGLAASSFATSLPFLFVTFGLISGTGLGLMYTPSIVIVNYFFERRRTVMNGLALSASGIGIIGSPILSRYLIDETTWRETLLILACCSAQVCVFGALMFPQHEPRSQCMQLYDRCRGIEGPNHEDEDAIWSEQLTNGVCEKAGDDYSVCSSNASKLLAANNCDGNRDVIGNHLARDSESERTDPEESQTKGADDIRRAALVNAAQRRGSGLENGHSVPSLRKEDCNETTENGVETGEQSHLLEHTSSQSKDHRQEKNGNITDNNTAPLIVAPDSPGIKHNHHFGSRKSLNKISHHLDGSKVRVLQDTSHNRYISSTHDIYRLHHHPESRLQSSLRPARRANSKGSKLDLRVVSVYSSIATLHSLGLPTAEEIVELSPSAVARKQPHDEEAGQFEDGRLSNLVIFKNIPFLFLLVNLFLSNAACGIFSIHLPAFSHQRNLDDYDITFALAMDGVAVFLSRVLLGILGNDDRVDKLALYFGLHLIASFMQATLPFATDLLSVSAFAVAMGTYYGGVYALLSSLTISLVGLPRLAFAFGVEMICAGLGYLVAPPLAGWIVDETGDYNNSMYLGGFLMFLSSIALLFLSCGRAPGLPPIGYHPVESDFEQKVKTEDEDEENL
ncbi:hypothetical protein V1264_009930 [Littorina saxatilis]|uniref:Uncharacterized protein n=2 Tax=Littorina saxatilis TaxID=31220 RepID=A0AAN9ANB5_9CAEN